LLTTLHLRTRAAALTGLLGLVAACAPGPRPAPVAIPAGLAPWELPPGAYPSQTLLRARVRGPEGEGRFRLVLRLASPSRYQLAAADALGRAAWSLDVEGGRAILLDHRRERTCAYRERLTLPRIRLGSLALDAVPRLLLGRLPGVPAGPAPAADGPIAYRDARGRQWTARVEAGRPVAWTMTEEGTPILWWRRADGEEILSHRDGLQLRLEATVREPLAGPLTPLEAPAGYREGGCDEPGLP
jgi:hypothetical protein